MTTKLSNRAPRDLAAKRKQHALHQLLFCLFAAAADCALGFACLVPEVEEPRVQCVGMTWLNLLWFRCRADNSKAGLYKSTGHNLQRRPQHHEVPLSMLHCDASALRSSEKHGAVVWRIECRYIDSVYAQGLLYLPWAPLDVT